MEERKRRISPTGNNSEGHAAQKRKLSSLSSSAPLSDLPQNADDAASKAAAEHESQLDSALGLEEGFLENFRKGALHRQMLEYKREWERYSAKAEKVEREWKDSNARLTELETCWERLVDELRTIAGDDKADADMVNGHSNTDESQLSQRLQETRQLIGIISKRASTSTAPDLVQRHASLSKELIQSQSAVKHLERMLQETRDELEKTLVALRASERRADRQSSNTARKFEKTPADVPSKSEGVKGDSKAAGAPVSSAPLPAANQAAPVVKHEIKEEVEQTEMRDVLEGSSGLTRTEIEALQQEAEARQKEADALRQEKDALMRELNSIKIKYADMPDEYIRTTQPFRELEAQMDRLCKASDNAIEALDKAEGELKELRANRETFRKEIETEYSQEAIKLRKNLDKLQIEAVRLRSERDVNAADLADAKAKEGEKFRHLNEMKVLADSRQARINSLVSEVYRLRMQIAAHEGDAALIQQYAGTLATLQSESTGASSMSQDAIIAAANESVLAEQALVKSLQDRVAELEALTATYREQLQVLSGAAADEDLDMAEQLVRSEAQAKANLEAAQTRIAKLEADIGSDDRPDVEKLTQRANAAEKAVSTLEAKVKAHEMSTVSLISEVSRLSETWEQLNKQNKSKILELSQYEVRLERLASDKAKANQKYFAAERDKEALNTQVTLYTRLSTSQKAALEKLDIERGHLLSKIGNLEKEAAEFDGVRKALEEKGKAHENEKTIAEGRLTSVQKQLREASTLLSERTSQYQIEENARKRAEEQISKLEKDVEKFKTKASQATAAANGQGRYVETDVKGMTEENTLLKRMLKCSSCRQKFKSHTITRCYHMFCKECIDLRLETRQRKCPSCSAAFGSADVQQVYF